MSRWYRHYAGLCRDEKLVRVAIKSRQPVERVVWVWCAILESAAEIDDNGRYCVDAAEFAYFLRADEADISGILVSLADAGRIADNRLVNWSKRQFSSDRSKERVAAYRERKRSESVRDDDIATSRADAVTLQKRYGNSPDTETETERGSSPEPTHQEAAREHEKPPIESLELKTRKRVASAYTAAGHLPPETGRVVSWMKRGHDPDVIVATIEDRLSTGPPPRSLAYFDGMIADRCASPPVRTPGTRTNVHRPRSFTAIAAEIADRLEGTDQFGSDPGFATIDAVREHGIELADPGDAFAGDFRDDGSPRRAAIA